jgi:hypothetical protein
MALEIGNAGATAGMTKAIFDKIDQQLSPNIPASGLEDVRKSWRQLAFAVATGVIEHLKANMEVFGIQTSGSITTTVTGTVSGAAVTGTGTGTVTPIQTGPTTGHIK